MVFSRPSAAVAKGAAMGDQLDMVSVAGPGGFSSAWAQFSACRRYRYVLGRRWDDGELLPWIMLNPSTADALKDDPTIRRCCGFAHSLGFGGIIVANVFAWRATDPDELGRVVDPVGQENDFWIRHVVEMGPGWYVCGWGDRGAGGRADWIVRALGEAGHEARALRVTKSGNPSHPLYLPRSLTPFALARTVRVNGRETAA